MARAPGPINRDDLLAGNFHRERHASRGASAIESRVLFARNEIRRALGAFLLGDASTFRPAFDDYLAGIRQRTRETEPVTAVELERFVDQWTPLLPANDSDRIATARALAARIPLDAACGPRTLSALSGGDPQLTAELVAGESPPPPPPARETTTIVDELEPFARWLRLDAGDILFERGSPSDAIYFVVSGAVRAFALAPDGELSWSGHFGRGDVCGEADVLTGEPRSFTAEAIRDSEVLSIGQQELLESARRHPDVLFRLTRAMAAHVRDQAESRSANTRSTGRAIALVPAHSSAPVEEWARALAVSLGELGPTLLVTRQEAQRRFGDAAVESSGAEVSALLAWLSEQEASHDFLVYECSDLDSAWSRRAARQSDRVVFVGVPGHHRPAAPPRIPGLVRDPAVDLLLVHPGDVAYPAETAAWAASMQTSSVLHVRQGDERRTRSVARRLGGRGVGVVFGGGAARGYAHIGIAKALEEAGIEVDVWGGTSMGALMAAGFAMGRDSLEMREHALKSASRRRLIDITPPFVAVTSGKKITELMREETAGLRIEDLWKAYFAVSTNLSQSRTTVIDSGPLWFAIRASIALPGLYPPMASASGELLVDGALMNNLPIDVMRARADVATVIGVNVSPARDRQSRWDFGPHLSGWPSVFSALRLPVRRRVPGIVSTLLRSTLVNSTAAMRSPAFRSHADLLIEPDVNRFGLLDFSSCDSLISAGYDAGRAALAEWPALSSVRPSGA